MFSVLCLFPIKSLISGQILLIYRIESVSVFVDNLNLDFLTALDCVSRSLVIFVHTAQTSTTWDSEEGCISPMEKQAPVLTWLLPSSR